MATDDVVPLYCVKQKWGKHKVFVVYRQKNGYRSNEDKLVSVFSSRQDAQTFIYKKQGW